MNKLLAKLQESREALQARLDELAARDTLTREDHARAFELLDEARGLDEQIDSLQADIERSETVAEERAATAAAAHAGENQAEERGAAVVTREERTYNPDAEKRGRSFMRDILAARQSSPEAGERLARHMSEERVERGSQIEARDVGTSNFAGLVVPQYLVDMVAPAARAMRPFADICTKLELPDAGNTVSIGRVTTGSAAAVQASENAGVQETGIDDTLLTVNVRTIAGQQDVSLQALERGQGVDTLVMRDLIAAYHTTLDNSILNDDGTSGTHLGLLSTSGIGSVTYTDASPTVAELYPKLFALISAVQSGVYMGISHLVMHPRRWNWVASAVGSDFPFINVGPAQQAGEFGSRQYGGVVGEIAGVPVIVDGNMATNLGTGTNEDVIIGVTSEESFLWEDPGAPIFIKADQPGIGNLTCKFVVYGFSAYTAGRYPGAHAKIGGTGLVTPSF